MDKKKLTIIIVGLVILAMFLTLRNCKLTPEIGRQQGVIEAGNETIREQDATIKTKDKAYRDAEKAHEKRLAELNGLIDSSNTVIARLEEEDNKSNVRIEELEELISQPSTSEEKIENMEKLTLELKNRFSICQQTITEKDAVIFSLSEKYESVLLLLPPLEAQVEAYRKGRQENLSQLKHYRQLSQKLSRQLRWNKSLRTGSILLSVGLTAYMLLNK